MNYRLKLHALGDIFRCFSNAPFSLFFLCAAGVATLSALLCLLVGLVRQEPDSYFLNLQFFLLLQSLAGSLYAGFLFTALTKWTEDPAMLGKHMQYLWLCWLIATVSVFVSLGVAFILMFGFWFLLFFFATKLVYKHRDKRQISFLLSVASMGLLTILLGIKVWFGAFSFYHWQQFLHLNLLAFILMSFRMSRVIGAQALAQQADNQFIPNPYYKNLQIGLLVALVVSNLIVGHNVIEGWLSLSVASVTIARLRDWHFIVFLKQPYVRWLYLSFMFIGISYAWRGLGLIGVSDTLLFNPKLAIYLLTFAGFLILSYQIMQFASLRNSHVQVVYSPSSRLAFLGLVIAGISSSLVSALMPEYELLLRVYVPNILILVAFSLYIFKFYQIFVRHNLTLIST